MGEFEHCQVLGPFNTGTALMHAYVKQLFQNFRPDRFPYWKHSLPPSYQRNSDNQVVADGSTGEFPGVLFVCMVRSPYFWLPATSRRHYNLNFHVHSFDMGQRLRSPVYFNGELFTNLVKVWNGFYRQYAAHLEPLGRVIYIRLEDLVKNPRDTLQVLETKLERKHGSDTQASIDLVTRAPRKVDNAFGETWEEKNRLDFVTRTLRSADLSFINQQLDPLLMKKFGYPWAWASPQGALL